MFRAIHLLIYLQNEYIFQVALCNSAPEPPILELSTWVDSQNVSAFYASPGELVGAVEYRFRKQFCRVKLAKTVDFWKRIESNYRNVRKCWTVPTYVKNSF